MDRKELLKWIRRFCEMAGLPPFFTFKQLKEAIEAFCNAPIEIEEQPLPYPTYGLSFKSDEGKYIIFFRPYLKIRDLILTITHELGHIVSGDVVVVCSKQQVLEAIKTGKEINEIVGIYCKSRELKFDTKKEQRAEYVGRFFERHLVVERDIKIEHFDNIWYNINTFFRSVVRGKK